MQRHRSVNELKSPQDAEVPPVEKKSKKPKKKEKKHKEKERDKEKKKDNEKKMEEEEKKVTFLSLFSPVFCLELDQVFSSDKFWPNLGSGGLNKGPN